jgi:hypothetical protein
MPLANAFANGARLITGLGGASLIVTQDEAGDRVSRLAVGARQRTR